MQIVQFTNIVVIIVSHLFLNNEICLQSRLPFDLFKVVDFKVECAAVDSSVCSHAFTLFLANTLVPSDVVVVFSKFLHCEVRESLLKK